MTRTIETIEYGDIDNETLLLIFGDEMTYNELKIYEKNKDDATDLKIEWNRNTETQLVRVWFNDKVVMDKKYSIHHSCDMFNYLSEFEPEEEEEEEEEDEEKYEDMCDCCVKGWDKINEFGRCTCVCSKCDTLLRDCKYNCPDEEEEETCEKCYLIECCCEADKLQVIKDNEKAIADGFIEVDGRWIKPKEKKQMW